LAVVVVGGAHQGMGAMARTVFKEEQASKSSGRATAARRPAKVGKKLKPGNGEGSDQAEGASPRDFCQAPA